MSEEKDQYQELVRSVLAEVVRRYKEHRKEGKSRDDFDTYDIVHEEIDGSAIVMYTGLARNCVFNATFDVLEELEPDDFESIKTNKWSFLAYKCAEIGVNDRLENELDNADQELEAEHEAFHASNPTLTAEDCWHRECDRDSEQEQVADEG